LYPITAKYESGWVKGYTQDRVGNIASDIVPTLVLVKIGTK
jgi:hypothetical protein